MVRGSIPRHLLLISLLLLITPALLAQQTGSVSGTVTTDGAPLPGVTVEARSTVLPQPRVVVTDATGRYRIPALPPGRYSVMFSLAGMQARTREVQVYLNQEAQANTELGVEVLAETITVTADTPMIDPTSTEVKSAVGADVIESLPVGQEYRDLVKLTPAVQYTEMGTRGPSAGGSGQDNMYQFDGVNVTLPLFGTLSAEPSTHDIQQISIIRGGAKATDFNRSAGFTFDSVSKSGTSSYMGEVSYQFRDSSMTADPDRSIVLQGDTTVSWLTANFGGPVIRDRLFFYGSYYRPEVGRDSGSNAYGDIPDFESTRNEYFAKLTFTPLSNVLLHGSYRDSQREASGENIGQFATPSLGASSAATLRIGIVEGSWVVSPRTFATFKFTDFANETSSVPDTLLSLQPSIALGTALDINNLERMGAVTVPCPIGRASGAPCIISAAPVNAHNTFIAPFIDRYGYIHESGERAGGGVVGAASQINPQDFYRTNWQAGYNFTLGTTVAHDLHVGYQWYRDEEDLRRSSNGWGSIGVTGGNTTCPAGTECAGQPVFFTARFIRSIGSVPENRIHSELVSQSVEMNDTVRWRNWAFNVGAIVSNDILYGQGLRNDSSTESGYVLSPGSKYKMYEVPWEKQIQPRLGSTWAYNGRDTAYVSYAKYNPPATSLPRAASWDRALLNFFYDAYFDENGVLIGSQAVGSSSGKLFVEDLDPRYVDEYLIGTSRQLTPAWSARLYARHRFSSNFWEDTNNGARVAFEPPPGVPRDPYIDNLNDLRRQICESDKTVCTGTLSGSSYVIAELDGAFTKYYEATAESEWRSGPTTLVGSYTWSQYYGNFDQDNTTGADNDMSTFIGSSNIADGAGRQMWDNKYGWLRGDRRHILKIYGTYRLPWNASVGAFTVYQSGEPWQAESWEPYQHLTTSRVTSNRFAEPAGSRRTPSHYQVDFNYTQNIPVRDLNFQLDLDVFNLSDNQTGYDFQPSVFSAGFGDPRRNYTPRRFQIAARLQF